jgi:hypothetical protein
MARPAVPEDPNASLNVLPLQSPLTAPPNDPRDFNGYWFSNGFANPSAAYRTADGAPMPFKGVAFGYVAYRLFMDRAGTPLPSESLLCRPGSFLEGLGGWIIQRPDRIIFLILEASTISVRNVYLDRPHPKKLTPSRYGHSVGHWDGNTLVIDTVGLDEKGFLVGQNPHSAQTHVVERMRRTGNGYEVLATIEDPVYYTKPFTIRRTYAWRNDLRWQPEVICEEDTRHTVVNGVAVDK